MNRLLKLIMIGILFLAGCGAQPKSVLPIVTEDPESMQFLVRQYHAAKNFTDFMPVIKEGTSEAETQQVEYGYTAITELQNLLKDAAVTETEDAPYDMDMFYMTKLADGTLYYFYTTGDLKVISGEERTFYKVDSEEYQMYVIDLHDRLAEVQWQ